METFQPRDGTFGGALYKNVNLADLNGATNLRGIAGMPYDLENGMPGQLDLPSGGTLPAGLIPLTRQDFIGLLEPSDLAQFGLNNNTTPDGNTICEKWEALALVPWDLADPANDDFLLLVGNDNDFRANTVYHNGSVVGSNGLSVDTMLLAYHLTPPGASVTVFPEGFAWLTILGLGLAG